jgi:hypothetical protein
MKDFFLKIVLTVACYVLPSFSAVAEIIFEDDFESSSSVKSGGWSAVGKNVTLETKNCNNSSKCVKIRYAEQGYSPYLLQKTIRDANVSEVYVRFYFKFDDPAICCPGGAKFLKFFGDRSGEGYANTTFGMGGLGESGTPVFRKLIYGDGSGTLNDAQASIRFDGVANDKLVEFKHFTDHFSANDGKWHHFEAYMKYNENGKRNGEYKVWFDGELKLHAVNVKNRNNLNTRKFERVALGDFHHDGGNTTWNIWYDDVVISTNYIGPADGLSPPKGLKIVQ